MKEFIRHIFGYKTKVKVDNEKEEVVIKFVEKGVATFVARKNEEGVVEVGWSRTCDEDQFVKREGVKIARSRFRPVDQALEDNNFLPRGNKKYNVDIKDAFVEFCSNAEEWHAKK